MGSADVEKVVVPVLRVFDSLSTLRTALRANTTVTHIKNVLPTADGIQAYNDRSRGVWIYYSTPSRPDGADILLNYGESLCSVDGVLVAYPVAKFDRIVAAQKAYAARQHRQEQSNGHVGRVKALLKMRRSKRDAVREQYNQIEREGE